MGVCDCVGCERLASECAMDLNRLASRLPVGRAGPRQTTAMRGWVWVCMCVRGWVFGWLQCRGEATHTLGYWYADWVENS